MAHGKCPLRDQANRPAICGHRSPLRKRSLVRPFNQFRKIGRRKAGHVDDGNPVKTPPVSGRLHPRNIRQFNEAIGRNSCAKAPPFRMTRFEISEFLTTHGVDKKIVGGLIESFGGTRKSTTKFFELADVHEGANRRAEAIGAAVLALIPVLDVVIVERALGPTRPARFMPLAFRRLEARGLTQLLLLGQALDTSLGMRRGSSPRVLPDREGRCVRLWLRGSAHRV